MSALRAVAKEMGASSLRMVRRRSFAAESSGSTVKEPVSHRRQPRARDRGSFERLSERLLSFRQSRSPTDIPSLEQSSRLPDAAPHGPSQRATAYPHPHPNPRPQAPARANDRSRNVSTSHTQRSFPSHAPTPPVHTAASHSNPFPHRPRVAMLPQPHHHHHHHHHDHYRHQQQHHHHKQQQQHRPYKAHHQPHSKARPGLSPRTVLNKTEFLEKCTPTNPLDMSIALEELAAQNMHVRLPSSFVFRTLHSHVAKRFYINQQLSHDQADYERLMKTFAEMMLYTLPRLNAVTLIPDLSLVLETVSVLSASPEVCPPEVRADTLKAIFSKLEESTTLTNYDIARIFTACNNSALFNDPRLLTFTESLIPRVEFTKPTHMLQFIHTRDMRRLLENILNLHPQHTAVTMRFVKELLAPEHVSALSFKTLNIMHDLAVEKFPPESRALMCENLIQGSYLRWKNTDDVNQDLQRHRAERLYHFAYHLTRYFRQLRLATTNAPSPAVVQLRDQCRHVLHIVTRTLYLNGAIPVYANIPHLFVELASNRHYRHDPSVTDRILIEQSNEFLQMPAEMLKWGVASAIQVMWAYGRNMRHHHLLRQLLVHYAPSVLEITDAPHNLMVASALYCYLPTAMGMRVRDHTAAQIVKLPSSLTAGHSLFFADERLSLDTICSFFENAPSERLSFRGINSDTYAFIENVLKPLRYQPYPKQDEVLRPLLASIINPAKGEELCLLDLSSLALTLNTYQHDLVHEMVMTISQSFMKCVASAPEDTLWLAANQIAWLFRTTRHVDIPLMEALSDRLVASPILPHTSQLAAFIYILGELNIPTVNLSPLLMTFIRDRPLSPANLVQLIVGGVYLRYHQPFYWVSLIPRLREFLSPSHPLDPDTRMRLTTTAAKLKVYLRMIEMPQLAETITYDEQLIQEIKHTVTVSRTQNRVAHVLKHAGLEGYVDEYFIEEISAVIDLANPTTKVAIEVDGPYHFASNDPTHVLGSTAFKRAALKFAGWEQRPVTIDSEINRELNELYSELCNRDRREADFVPEPKLEIEPSTSPRHRGKFKKYF